MIYKIGDKVKIKEKSLVGQYRPDAIDYLKKYDYTLTIKEIDNYIITMEETEDMTWTAEQIEYIKPEPQDPKELINDRFEILDL